MIHLFKIMMHIIKQTLFSVLTLLPFLQIINGKITIIDDTLKIIFNHAFTLEFVHKCDVGFNLSLILPVYILNLFV